MASLKSKIEGLEKDLQKSKKKYDECLVEIKKEISENYYLNDFKNQVRRVVSLFYGEYFKYDFDVFNNGFTLQFSDNRCVLVKTFGYMTQLNYEEKGFIFILDDILEVYNISRYLEKMWIYHCKRNSYRKSFEDFKTIEPLTLIDIYIDWYGDEHSETYMVKEILTYEDLGINNIVIVTINNK